MSLFQIRQATGQSVSGEQFMSSIFMMNVTACYR